MAKAKAKSDTVPPPMAAPVNVEALKLAAQARQTNSAYFAPTDDMLGALALGYVETSANPEHMQNGMQPYRATDSGLAHLASLQPAAPAAPWAVPAAGAPTLPVNTPAVETRHRAPAYQPPNGAWKLDDAVAMPPKATRGRLAGQSVYPFHTMGVGQSFFIPETSDRKAPWKGMASTVNNANKRDFSGSKRRFEARHVTEVGMAGVRVWRVG